MFIISRSFKKIISGAFAAIFASAIFFCVSVQASVNARTADLVLGQANFTRDDGRKPVSASTLDGPYEVAIDTTSGRVYAADSGNNRVLWWNSASSLENGAAADGVIGQPDFTTITSAATQSGMNSPTGVAVDSLGNVWVADYGNRRVLKFTAPTTNGQAAALVLGQTNFTSNTAATTQSSMNNPISVTVDSSGNVWVSDTANRRVLKFTGELTNGCSAALVLGQANFTSNAAATTQWRMNNPTSVAIDSSGNVWVADYGNRRVLKFTGELTNGCSAALVLGQTNFTSNTVAVTQSGLQNPAGVVVDGSGNVWVSDEGNYRVLKFTTPTTNGQNAALVLGQANFTSNTAATTQSGMDDVRGVALDAYGNVWVTDRDNHRILKFTTPTTNGPNAALVLGQNNFVDKGSYLPHAARFTMPKHAVMDTTSGRVYVADSNNNRVLWWNSASLLENGASADGVLGQPDFITKTADTTQSKMRRPKGIAVDSSGNVWVADEENNRVLKFTAPTTNGQAAALVLGQPDFTSFNSLTTQSGMSGPTGVAVDASGNVWVADYTNSRVLKFTTPTTNGQNASLVLGKTNFTYNTQETTQSGMNAPIDVAVDSSGNVWVVDNFNNRVLKFTTPTTNGQAAALVLGQADFESSNLATTQSGMWAPMGISVDSSGNVWVADMGNNRVLKFTAPTTNGQAASLVLGQADYISNVLSTTQSGMINPYGISVDSFGNVWVADTYNSRVLRFDELQISAITPATGVNTGTVNITNLAGKALAEGATVKLTKTGESDITATAVNVVSANKITCTFDLTGKTTGYWNVVASTGGAGSTSSTLSDGFLITSFSLASITPNTASNTGTVNITNIAGENFPANVTVKLTKTGQEYILASSITVVSANKITCAFDLTGKVTGYWNVVVSTANGLVSSTIENSFLITSIVVSSITPNTASNAGTVNITNITGENFPANVTVKLTKTGQDYILASSITVVSSNKITCTFDLTGKTTGYWNVVVSTGGAGSMSSILANGFSITAAVVVTTTTQTTITSTSTVTTEINIDPSANAELKIDPASGEIKVGVPAGTFGTNVVLTVSTSTVPLSTKATIKVSNICITIINSLGLQPDKLITLTVNYRHADIAGLDETKLAICRYDPVNDMWIKLPSSVDAVSNIITATTNHLSMFVVVQLAPALDLNSVRAYPNPYKPSIHSGGITFDSLTANAKIKVFNLAGELVSEMSDADGDGAINWDGVNNSGKKLASGVYIAYIEGAGTNKKVKFAIIK